MNKDYIKALLNQYQYHTCLWDVSCKDYNDKIKKEMAYKDLIQVSKRYVGDVDRTAIQNKLQNLRTAFRKELRKVEDSKKSGCDPEDEYVPKLWYFDLLLFTRHITTSRAPIEYSGDMVQYESFVEALDDDCNTNEESPLTIVEHMSSSPPPIVVPVTRKKRKNSDEYFIPISQTLPEINAVKSLNEYDAIGIAWAAKLKRMDEVQRILAESLINKILEKGFFHELSRDMAVVDKENLKMQSGFFKYHDNDQ